MNIAQLLEVGESKTLEFKQDASSLLPMMKSLIAFANTAGGVMLVGISDDRKVVGVDTPDSIRDKIACSIANNISPQLFVDINVLTYEQKSILVIQVEFGKNIYFLKSEGIEKGTYIRLGATNRIASPETLVELRRQLSHIRFDAQPCLDATVHDLDQTLLQNYFDMIHQTNSHKNQLSLGIISQEGSRFRPTNAGIILFGQKEKRVELFPNTRISCARFKGNTKAQFIDKQDMDIDLLSAINEIPKFIERHTLNRVQFVGMLREETPEYPSIAIREVLINAFVHANYEVMGSRFLIAIYDDRIEIQNPGILLPGMTLEYLKAGVSRIRNTVIARIFREAKMVEEWGSCYERVTSACQALNCLEPKWEEMGSLLRVTFYPSHIPDLVPVGDQVGTKWGLSQESIRLLQLTKSPQSQTILMEAFQLKHKTKFRQKYIQPLLEQGVLAMTIPDKPNSRLQQYVTTKKGLDMIQEDAS